MKPFSYFKIFKPYGMLSQFSKEGEHPTLADLKFSFPKDVYPVGRLDHDSEGLLLLTNDARANQLFLNPKNKTEKTYWVQVEGDPDEVALSSLSDGVEINLKGTRLITLPAKVKLIPIPDIEERIPSVNYIKHPTTSWLEIKITEGKNRQIRKMAAKVGHPALRLIRYAVGNISIDEMKPGGVVELENFR